MIAISIHQSITIYHSHFSVYKHICELTSCRSGSRCRQRSRGQTSSRPLSRPQHTGSPSGRCSRCWRRSAAALSLSRGPNCSLQSSHYSCRWRNRWHSPKGSPNPWNIFIFFVMINKWKHNFKKVWTQYIMILREYSRLICHQWQSHCQLNWNKTISKKTVSLIKNGYYWFRTNSLSSLCETSNTIPHRLVQHGEDLLSGPTIADRHVEDPRLRTTSLLLEATDKDGQKLVPLPVVTLIYHDGERAGPASVQHRFRSLRGETTLDHLQ